MATRTGPQRIARRVRGRITRIRTPRTVRRRTITSPIRIQRTALPYLYLQVSFGGLRLIFIWRRHRRAPLYLAVAPNRVTGVRQGSLLGPLLFLCVVKTKKVINCQLAIILIIQIHDKSIRFIKKLYCTKENVMDVPSKIAYMSLLEKIPESYFAVICW